MKSRHFRAVKMVVISIAVATSSILGPVTYADTADVKRDQISEKYKWNLEAIYPSIEVWNKDCEKVTTQYIPKFSQHVGNLSNKESLVDCLALLEEAGRLVEKLSVYAQMKSDEDTSNSTASELSNKAIMLQSDFDKATAFISPELMSYDENTIKGYFNDQALQKYKFYIERVYKNKEHTLSKSEEELLAEAASMSTAPSEIFSKLSYSDMEFPKVKTSSGEKLEASNLNYGVFVQDKNRDVRKEAFDKMYGVYNKFKSTFAATLNGEIAKNVFFARSRKYASTKEEALQSEFIPTSVYDQLLSATNENLGYLHKYVSLRKQVLKLDKVHIYDMYVPLVKGYNPKIPYPQAMQILTKSLAPLGKDYINTLKQGLNGRWIDVYSTDNKYTGAYQWGTYDTSPYILMNYRNDLDSMNTLGHEMGHAIHSYYTNKNQDYQNARTPIFNCEVASTTNEMFMYNQLIKSAKTKKEKTFYLTSLIENIMATFFTQVMYAEFEKTIYERVESGIPLSAESFSNIYNDLLVKYFGPDFQKDELSGLAWARISHFYSRFYVYKYATSISAAEQIYKNITDSKLGAANTKKYLDFLKAGNSDYPIEVLKKAGVDLTSPEPTRNLIKHFGELVDELDKLLK